MDVVGSEIGQKMRSAIKAKLTELGCYVDDELPDYVMVMVANKRTRAQMEDDLQLFLGDNTELFVNWLHQVLKKLQEVTITPLKTAEIEKSKEKSKKSKEKKEKEKSKVKKADNLKKAKKKDKEKEKLRKKEEKKSHKSKKEKKSKHHEIIRPNIPPLLMNIEKESEPSITDVFAGQILKNHGITINLPKEEKVADVKPIIKEPKRPILPIIDPATISSQPEPIEPSVSNADNTTLTVGAPREEQIKEINEIEAKIQGLKQKLAEQLDSMSDDDDFLNIRTEAEELMNDFAEDVFQEISSQAPVVTATPPTQSQEKNLVPPQPSAPLPKIIEPIETQIPKELESPKNLEPSKEPETPKEPEPLKEPELPHIELNLPKRPIRERLGVKDDSKKTKEVPTKNAPEVAVTKTVEPTTVVTEKERTKSPERFTPEREPDFWGKHRPARSRLGNQVDKPKRRSKSESEESEIPEPSAKKGVLSSVSVCTSVVRVRPRPRAPASSLLMRAVADAHKSLLNIPPKVEPEPAKVKRALVLPMRRCVDAQNIVIQVPADRRADDDNIDKMDLEKDEYVPASLSKKVLSPEYVPSRRTARGPRSDRTDRTDRTERSTSRRDDTLIVETINIHNTTVDKDKDTQFIVTMDGFNPNAFLAKKLKTEGLLDDEEEVAKPKDTKTALKTKTVLKTPEVEKEPDKNDEEDKSSEKTPENKPVEEKKVSESPEMPGQKKRLSDTSDDSDTQVIIKQNLEQTNLPEKRKGIETPKEKPEDTPPVKKRRASPIVFDVGKKEREDRKKEGERTRERTESASSDNHVIVTTTSSSHKYDALPALSPSVVPAAPAWCRSFPLCRYGAACAFQHPRCKFAAACTRRGCPYAHAHNAPIAPVAPIAAANIAPTVASHVVPAANYKSISGSIPSVCKYYPNCANPTCHYYHPKPCRYGKACANKLECNFYHNDVPAKYRYPV